MALGVSLLETSGAGALTLLVAIFASNLPEALGGAVGMREQGRSKGFTIGVWSALAALSGVSEDPLSVLLSFAGGAVLASLAVAFATAAGFLLSFLLAEG